VLSTPAGQPFCFVSELGDSARRVPEPPRFGSGRHLADQLSLDLPAADFERDADFWAALTGWPRRGQEDEFDRIAVPARLPAQLLLQRLDEDAPDGVHAHLDLCADDRDAEVRRHQELGAELVRRTEHWTTLRDPAGFVYCVTARRPGVRFT
jgi:predicted enzyme related to lactoylglutathione lyase